MSYTRRHSSTVIPAGSLFHVSMKLYECYFKELMLKKSPAYARKHYRGLYTSKQPKKLIPSKQ